MKKSVRKKKRIVIKNFAIVLFGFSVCLQIASSLFIRNINNSLTMKIEDCNSEASALKTTNEQLSIEIQGLVSKDRVYEIATAAGLSQNSDNVNNVIRGE